MRALKPRSRVPRLLAGLTDEDGRRVLPPLLRRPARLLARLDWHLPRHAGAKGALALMALTGATGLVAGGHLSPVASWVSARAGMAITSVRITGQSETSELDVLDRLALDPEASLLTLDVAEAKARIEALPWIKQASMRKVYPHGLAIVIEERAPYALWRRGEAVSLIDRQGKVIAGFDPRFANLPLVVGDKAGARAVEIVELVKTFPALKARVRAAVRVGDRRWNLVLESGTEILLPEEDAAAALARIVEVDTATGLLARDVSRVDLRLGDRLVVRLTDEGLTRLKAGEARPKPAKKGAA